MVLSVGIVPTLLAIGMREWQGVRSASRCGGDLPSAAWPPA